MTDRFHGDFMRMMRSKQDPTAFPVFEYEYNLAERDYDQSRNLRIVDRIQVKFAAGQHAFILRHPTRYHWCGYIHTTAEAWQTHRAELESNSGANFISYALPAFEPICWMVRNANGGLKKAVDITPEGDFFIGFDTSTWEREMSLSSDYALAALEGFNEVVQRIIK